jgi:hypothetical protein
MSTYGYGCGIVYGCCITMCSLQRTLGDVLKGILVVEQFCLARSSALIATSWTSPGEAEPLERIQSSVLMPFLPLDTTAARQHQLEAAHENAQKTPDNFGHGMANC